MFFPEKIKSIKLNDRVLEVGPGSSPHPRSNVFLERRFEPSEAYVQRGYTYQVELKNIFYYDGGRFPFEDNSFDYVICSHVIEHIPDGDLELFISELQRIAPMGYIEVPNAFYELINYQDVHKWFVGMDGDKLTFLAKEAIPYGPFFYKFRERFYLLRDNLSAVFRKTPEFFFIGYEWNKSISFDKVTSLDHLFGVKELENLLTVDIPLEDDFMVKPMRRSFGQRALSYALRIVRKTFSWLNGFISDIKGIIYPPKIVNPIWPTADVDNIDMVIVAPSAEVKDYVIIRAYHEKIVVGNNSQINPFTVIYVGSPIVIGDNVMIGPHCMISSADHDFIQTSAPMRFAGNLSDGPIIIEDDVWIGANCVITDGVRIGRGAVIGAGTVVTKDVPPFGVVVGASQRLLKMRKEIID